ncbi:metallophosphoesterase [Sedimentibacter sp. MB31-C6]|uniref:metallophosphoesterase n=1 Tax=Sedimentibacter sp. MB31-C6 TaxID=3109366 RepID=UPI002DDC9273|nr:metallophosphoesterase [Sedimentibacter sp. MB36-C1]WSI03271.1 metallophosphoesterase [Sedimentibacter sp. MB36-C1]
MDVLNRINNIFFSSKEIVFDNSSKFILMSDCHRGTGGWEDNFSNNQNIYFAALNYYYKENYTYIELGDGDELWENSDITDIIQEHSDIFWLLRKFYKEKRLYFIYGNHDMLKKNTKFIEKKLTYYFYERNNKYYLLFNDVKIHEGIVLKHKETGNKILLIHGHQVDCLNYKLWRLARLLVRYFWKPLETFGVKDVTRTAKNYKKKYLVAKKLTEWVIRENHMLIAGHNHRPFFPEIGEPPYFNDGSCVHPRCITGIEISDGSICLIKWSIKTNKKNNLIISKDILAGPRRIKDYFNKSVQF